MGTKRNVYAVDLEQRITRIMTVNVAQTSEEAAGALAMEMAKLGFIDWHGAEKHVTVSVLVTEKIREVDDGIPE